MFNLLDRVAAAYLAARTKSKEINSPSHRFKVALAAEGEVIKAAFNALRDEPDLRPIEVNPD